MSTVNKILDNHDMSADIESSFYRLFGNEFNKPGQSAVQINWDGVTGTLDGEVEVYLTIDDEAGTDDNASKALMETVNVTSASNLTNTTLILVNGVVRYCKVKYIKNGVTGGDLTVFAAKVGEGR